MEWPDLGREVQRLGQTVADCAQGLVHGIEHHSRCQQAQLHRVASELQQAGLQHLARGRRQAPLLAALPFGKRQQPPPPQQSGYPEDMLSRLASVPVYAVANKQNEFVLVAAEDDHGKEAGRNMLLGFMCEADAHAMARKVKEANAGMGKSVRVLKLSANEIYKVAEAQQKAGDADLMVRLMPDATEVQTALELYEEAGINTQSFVGVPLFQAAGLSIRTSQGSYSPLFLSKADLDLAVENVFSLRDTKKEASTQEQFKAASEELAVAEAALEAADQKGRKAAQKQKDQAASRLHSFSKELDSLRAMPPPRIEVGCLEEVISRMKDDNAGPWRHMMLVPPGSMP